MAFDIRQLKPYLSYGLQLIPLHPWNKQVDGLPMGKRPIHNEWTTRDYPKTKEAYDNWIKHGYNLGFRIPERIVALDIDPRNFDPEIDSLAQLSKLFSCENIKEVMQEHTCVKTGGGGLHIYLTLPADINYKLIRPGVDSLPGVEFKRQGFNLVAAGSRHPSGRYYKWKNDSRPKEIPKKLLKLILREKSNKNESDLGYGAFTGAQIQEFFLNKLDVADYSSNDEWFPLMAECYHATAGEGLQEFLDWSLSDPFYSDDESIITARWNSLSDNPESSRTVASLIHRLKNLGEDTADIRRILDFSKLVEKPDINDSDDESDILKKTDELVEIIDIEELIDLPSKTEMQEGKVIEACKYVQHNASMDDKMKIIRMIKSASLQESIEAQEILIKRKIMTSAGINKRLKAIETDIADSISEIIANVTMESIFNKGKYIITEPNRQLWVYNSTHWKPLPDEYLGKIIFRVLDRFKDKLQVKIQEVSIVTTAIKAIRIRASVLDTKLFNTEKFLPIINCNNGEIHMNSDGTHSLKTHHYQSFQIRTLNVDYDPSAQCPIFLKMLDGIFKNYKDKDQIISYLAEVFGYIIQPYKPEAAWWMFRGPGGDGKSTILKVLNGVLGAAYLSADECILSAGNGANAHATADLVGKLAVVVEEMRVGIPLNDSGLKMLAENTKMTANPKHKDPFSFNYVGSLIMCSNGYPTIRDTSEGTRRRANVIPFNRKFVATGEEDRSLAKRILGSKEEMAGVLIWMLKGYKRYMKRGCFNIPKSCQVAKNEWLCQANNVLRFARDNIELTDDKTICLGTGRELHQLYEEWCIEDAVKPKTRNNFYNELVNLGLTKKKSGGNMLHFYGGVLKA